MNTLKKVGLLLWLVLISLQSYEQQASAVESLKSALANAKTTSEKANLLDNLSRVLMMVDPPLADDYGKQLISLAEESRDRRLMVDAYISNGLRCSHFARQKEYVNRALEYYRTALFLARKEDLDDKAAGAHLLIATICLALPDKDRALNNVNQAASIISTLGNDSLQAEMYNTYGIVYLARNDKLLALRSYFTALRIAESMHNEDSRNTLLRHCYLNLSHFYQEMGEYDKAIDYARQAYEKLDLIKEKAAPFQKPIDLNSIGNIFSLKKNYDIANHYFDKSVAIADSLNVPTLKVYAYTSLLTQDLRLDEAGKALEHMRSAPGQKMTKVLTQFGLTGPLNEAYGVIYTRLNQFDSAEAYFTKAAPYFEKASIEAQRLDFYNHQAELYVKRGNTQKAIDFYRKVKEMGERMGNLELVVVATKQLDSLYYLVGNYPLSRHFNQLSYFYKDSLEQLKKEKELAQVEIADEQQRQHRLAMELEEKKKRRVNIQYLGIVIGITLSFMLLVILGMFKVSATTIKNLGFFAFIMLFEFIFLVFKKHIYFITKGEPLYDLFFLMGLAALLLPLHHWAEEKAISYLTSHNRLTSAGQNIKTKFFKRKTTG